MNRDLDEWSRNLSDLLSVSDVNTWLYIQAYDEWAEGSTLAPTKSHGYSFLATLRERLQACNWLASEGPYQAPKPRSWVEARYMQYGLELSDFDHDHWNEHLRRVGEVEWEAAFRRDVVMRLFANCGQTIDEEEHTFWTAHLSNNINDIPKFLADVKRKCEG